MRLAALLMALLLFAACAQKPKVIPPAQMTKILWDLIQVDEFASNNIAPDTTKNLKTERQKLYQQVYNIHHVTHKQFEGSFKYYAGKPDEMKALFDTLSVMGERARRNLNSAKDSTLK